MHDIAMHEASPEFARCWQGAGRHLERQVQGGLRSWCKVDLVPPFLEHLSFRLGNQLFFVRIEDAEGQLVVPGSREGVFRVAEGCAGHACLMPMRKRGTIWEPVEPGWGLADLRTGALLDPLAHVTDALIEMTAWEVHDLAVQVLRDQLRAQGRQIMSSQGNPDVDPSLWFVGDRGPEWVVVRASRHPAEMPPRPANWSTIAARCAALSPNGHYVAASVRNGDAPDAPLWRGHALDVVFSALPG